MINLEMPEDVQEFVREYQGKLKAKKNFGQYSLQKCIVLIIREYMALEKKTHPGQSPGAPMDEPQEED